MSKIESLKKIKIKKFFFGGYYSETKNLVGSAKIKGGYYYEIYGNSSLILGTTVNLFKFLSPFS